MAFLELKVGIFLFMKLSWPFWRTAKCGDSCLRHQLVKPGFIEEETESYTQGCQLSKVSWATPVFVFGPVLYPNFKKKISLYGEVAMKIGLCEEPWSQKCLFLAKSWLGEKLEGDLNLFIFDLLSSLDRQRLAQWLAEAA